MVSRMREKPFSPKAGTGPAATQRAVLLDDKIGRPFIQEYENNS